MLTVTAPLPRKFPLLNLYGVSCEAERGVQGAWLYSQLKLYEFADVSVWV